MNLCRLFCVPTDMAALVIIWHIYSLLNTKSDLVTVKVDCQSHIRIEEQLAGSVRHRKRCLLRHKLWCANICDCH